MLFFAIFSLRYYPDLPVEVYLGLLLLLILGTIFLYSQDHFVRAE